MNAWRLLRFLALRVTAGLVMGSAAWTAAAQGDPPGRVASLNTAEGPVVFAAAGDNEWTEVPANRPITRGDKLWTDRKARADIQVGSATVRMGGKTLLEIQNLDDQAAQLGLDQGSVIARVRHLGAGETFLVRTPQL